MGVFSSLLTASAAEITQYNTFRTYIDLPANSNVAEGYFYFRYNTSILSLIKVTANRSMLEDGYLWGDTDSGAGYYLAQFGVYERQPITQAGYVGTLSWKTPTSNTTFPGTEYIVHTIKDINGNVLSPTTATVSTVFVGDVNQDGEVGLTDIIDINYYTTGSKSLTKAQQRAADVDNNGVVNSADAQMIADYLVKSISHFK